MKFYDCYHRNKRPRPKKHDTKLSTSIVIIIIDLLQPDSGFPFTSAVIVLRKVADPNDPTRFTVTTWKDCRQFKRHG